MDSVTMTSTRAPTLENSAETKLPAPSLSEMPSAPCKKRQTSSSMSRNTAKSGHVAKNKRTRYSAYQIETLKKTFESTKYPDFDQIEALAQELALEREVVKVWFKNRRARQKAQEQEDVSRLLLERRSITLSSQMLCACPTPAYYYPMCPVFPWQPMMNSHENSAFGLFDRLTNNTNLYQNSHGVGLHSLEHPFNEPVSCYQWDDLSRNSSY